MYNSQGKNLDEKEVSVPSPVKRLLKVFNLGKHPKQDGLDGFERSEILG